MGPRFHMLQQRLPTAIDQTTTTTSESFHPPHGGTFSPVHVQSIVTQVNKNRQTNDSHNIGEFCVFQDVQKTPKYKCSHCDFQSAYRFTLERHQKKHTGDFYFCHMCSCKFYDKYHLNCHLKGHAGELKCRYCGKNFTSMTGLQNHEMCYCKH